MTPSRPTSQPIETYPEMDKVIKDLLNDDVPHQAYAKARIIKLEAESTRLEAELSEVKSQLSEAKRVEGKMKQVLENIAREKDCPSLTHCSCACSYEIQAAEALVKRGEEKP